MPVREELGVLLLAAGRGEEAERAFREDLKRFPDNGWSLHGLARSLRVQNRATDASRAMERFRATWAAADVPI